MYERNIFFFLSKLIFIHIIFLHNFLYCPNLLFHDRKNSYQQEDKILSVEMLWWLVLGVGVAGLGADTIVHTTYGPVRGQAVHSWDARYAKNISYIQFNTIPFAAPPIGERRFRPPVPPVPWSQPPDLADLYWRICYQVCTAACPRSSFVTLYI